MYLLWNQETPGDTDFTTALEENRDVIAVRDVEFISCSDAPFSL